MHITLALAKQVVTWDGKWFFLGEDFLLMQNWEKRLRGERISLTVRMLHQSKELRNPFLEWLEAQRITHEDSLVWWMTHLAGRNVLVSQLYLHLCQIKALLEVLKKKTPEYPEKLLIVCEDSFLLLTVQRILEKQFPCKRVDRWLMAFIAEWAYLFASFCFSWQKEIVCSLRMRWNAWRTRSDYIPFIRDSSKQTVFLQRCLDDKSFRPQGIQDRYFVGLPDFLRQQGCEVITLPWLWNISLPLSQVFRQLRKESTLVVEDHIKLQDYFFAFWQHMRTAFLWKGKHFFQEIEITPLLWRENISNARTGLIQFWLYQPALQRWADNFPRTEKREVLLIQIFEGMPPEHVQIFTLQQQFQRLRVVGYCHTLATHEFLPYHFIASEWDSKIMPDMIVTNGELWRQTLIKQGAPLERVKAGPALRQDFSNLSRNMIDKGNGLLLLLPIGLGTAVELTILLAKINPKLQKKYGIPVQIKPHPMMSPKSLLTRSNLIKLPENWTWADGEIHEHLEDTFCCVASMTSAVYDAVLAGCITISTQRELGLMSNYFDILEDDFPILRTVMPDKLWEWLDAAFGEKRDTFCTEFDQVRQRLIQGLSQPSDETMSAFIS